MGVDYKNSESSVLIGGLKNNHPSRNLTTQHIGVGFVYLRQGVSF
jgi:hypothetical protein